MGILLPQRRVLLPPPWPSLSRTQAISLLTTLVGSANLTMLYLPNGTDTTTSVESSSSGRTITWDATIASRFTRWGNGFFQSFNGSTQYGELADNAAFSFGNGAADSAFSIVWMGLLRSNTTANCLLAKTTTSNREWRFLTGGTSLLQLSITDESASGATASIFTTTPIPINTLLTLGVTYDPSLGSGATAAAGMRFYIQGAAVPVTQSNNASYVAMENLASTVEMGARIAHTQDFLNGHLGGNMLVTGALSAAQHARIHAVFSALYGR